MHANVSLFKSSNDLKFLAKQLVFQELLTLLTDLKVLTQYYYRVTNRVLLKPPRIFELFSAQTRTVRFEHFELTFSQILYQFVINLYNKFCLTEL